MDTRLLVVAYLMICGVTIINASPYRSRSRNKNSAPTYDQKQTGEYNIQLHLKDFEVVALLSDGAFGDLGEYDYNYDYSELTIKPPFGSQSTTSTPTTSSTTTTQRPSQKPETILPPTSTITTPQEISSTTSEVAQTTKNNLNEVSTTEKVVAITTQSPVISSNAPPMRLDNELETNATITKDEQTIKTEIVVKPVENLTIIDNKEHNGQEENLPLVVHRKCASGFTRDKLGRCRRVRRPPPQFSFGISRLASLASKLRQATNDSSPTSSQQSNESDLDD